MIVAPTADSSAHMVLAEVSIRQRTIIRVPTRPSPPPTKKWITKRAKRCMSPVGVAGAAVVSPREVDFIYRGGRRFRAELKGSCVALDFYNGFYLRPDPNDGEICADRDAIHARSGGECEIDRFREVLPAPDRTK